MNETISKYRSYILIVGLLSAISFCSCTQSEKADVDGGPVEENDIEIKMGPFDAESLKKNYYRYEFVEIEARFDLDKLPSGDDAELTASVSRDGEPVPDVAGRDGMRFVQKEPGVYVAHWPIPWNPELGEYECTVTGDMSGKRVSDTCKFVVKGRPTVKMKPLCVVNLESDTRFKNRPVVGPDGRTTGWEQLVAWAEFMGADAMFYLTGITKQMYGPTMDDPWYDANREFAEDLGGEAHKRGMKFGGWIGAYLPYGQTQVGLPYKFSRNLVEGQFYYTLHVSLNDEERRKQITELCKEMEASDNFDFIGIDYIRTGFGGYELVDEFVEEMQIEVPTDFHERGLEGRMWWLVSKLRSRDPVMIDLWQWWRASKAARTLKTIKEEAGVTKPFYCFCLSYEFGHQHGQDSLMMYDAGADFVMLMLYDADRNNFDYLVKSWPTFIEEGDGSLVPGLSVDYRFLENKWNPAVNQPMEMFNRYNDVVTKFYPDGSVEGLFFHDLDRALYTRKGEDFIGMDYIVAGGSAFSRLREREKAIPLKLRIENVRGGGVMDCTLENISDEAVDNIEISVPETHGVATGKASEKRIKTIAPGETVEFTLKPRAGGIGRLTILAVMATWGDNPTPQDRAMDIVCVWLG